MKSILGFTARASNYAMFCTPVTNVCTDASSCMWFFRCAVARLLVSNIPSVAIRLRFEEVPCGSARGAWDCARPLLRSFQCEAGHALQVSVLMELALPGESALAGFAQRCYCWRLGHWPRRLPPNN